MYKEAMWRLIHETKSCLWPYCGALQLIIAGVFPINLEHSRKKVPFHVRNQLAEVFHGYGGRCTMSGWRERSTFIPDWVWQKKTLTHTHFNKPTSVRLCVSAAEGRVGGLGCHSHDVRNPPACVNERGVLAKSRFFAVPYHFEEVCMQWQSSFLKKSLMFF